MRARTVAIAGAALVAAAPAGAHHSISKHYDRNQSVTLSGVVTAVLFRNPHAHIELEVRGAAGAAESWSLEWDDVSDLRRQDVGADTVRAGDEVVVTGDAARDGSRTIYIRTLSRPADGFEYLDD